MSRGRQISVEVRRAVQELVLEGYGKAPIYRELQRRGLIDAGGSPSKSTIDRVVDELKPADASDPWSAMNASAEDAQLMLEVLAYVFRKTEGREWPTQDLAHWVVQVRQRVPAAPIDWAYALGLAYQWSTTRGRDTRDLDLTLAMTPWSGPHDAVDWATAVRVMGERVNEWSGGGPGLVALAVDFPPPDWAAQKGSWGEYLWQLLIEGDKPQNRETGHEPDRLEADRHSPTRRAGGDEPSER